MTAMPFSPAALPHLEAAASPARSMILPNSVCKLAGRSFPPDEPRRVPTLDELIDQILADEATVVRLDPASPRYARDHAMAQALLAITVGAAKLRLASHEISDAGFRFRRRILEGQPQAACEIGYRREVAEAEEAAQIEIERLKIERLGQRSAAE